MLGIILLGKAVFFGIYLIKVSFALGVAALSALSPTKSESEPEPEPLTLFEKISLFGTFGGMGLKSVGLYGINNWNGVIGAWSSAVALLLGSALFFGVLFISGGREVYKKFKGKE